MAQRRRRRQNQQAVILKQCPKKDCGERIVEKVQVEVELSLFKWFGFWKIFGSEHQKITLQENCHNFWHRRAFSKRIAVSEIWEETLQDCIKTLVPAATGEIVFQVEKRLLQKIGTPDFWAVWVLSTILEAIGSVAGEESPVNASGESFVDLRPWKGESLAKFWFWKSFYKG